ncbi:hypothetical protein KKB43_04205 [Patescibacteria group bacterium]|nr:hypothetical protein [Patescibacteria group bacterium]MBU4580191.1 hypothetical protein [Patescibacteria group bacterium]
MNQKGISSILIILIIVGVLVGGGLVWYYQKTLQIISKPAPQVTPVDETANWKTYRNDEYGFEVKYPTAWEISSDKSGVTISPNTPTTMSLKERQNLSELWPSFSIGFTDNKNNLSLNDFFKKEILPNLRLDIDHKVQQVKIGNNDAIVFVELGMIESKEYIMAQNSKFVEIFFANEEVIPNTPVVPIFNQILSTFKFIK